MKNKYLVALSMFLATCLGTFAQDGVEYLPKTTIWGIKGNLNAELPSKWKGKSDSMKMYNTGFGVSIGGLANVYLGKNFYFEPELSLFYTGYSYDKVISVAPNSPMVNDGPKIYKFGLRMPLVIGYEINISDIWGLRVFTGPQVSYGLYGTVKTNIEEFKTEGNLMTIYGNKDYSQRRFDLGWKVGVGFPVDHFMISLEGDIGITDMLKQTAHTFRENRVSLGITYYFVN